jgi:RES domain-containing protein
VALARGPETGVWYRAIQPQFWPTALRTAQTKTVPSRYNEGSRALPPFEVLYLAEDHLVALLEVQGMFGSPFPHPGRALVPNPRQSWAILNVRVTLQQVADLTRVSQQSLIDVSAQELTGDWAGYQQRHPHDSVNQPVGTAPTQALGQALFAVVGLEGFRTISARMPTRMSLVVFPEKLLAGSLVEFEDPMSGRTHTIRPKAAGRRRGK